MIIQTHTLSRRGLWLALAAWGCLLVGPLTAQADVPPVARQAAKAPTSRQATRTAPQPNAAQPTAPRRKAAARRQAPKASAPRPAAPASQPAPPRGQAATDKGSKGNPPRRKDATDDGDQAQASRRPTSRPASSSSTDDDDPVVAGGLQKTPTGFATRGPKRPGPKLFSSTSRSSLFWSQVLGMLVVLGVVVLLIVVLLRWAASQMGLQTQTNQRLLKVVDRLSLEHKKGLWLIEAGDHYLLLATHEQGVTMLDRLESRAIKAQLPDEEATPSGFWERLRRGKGAASEQPQSDGENDRPTPASAQDTPATHASTAASAETETPTAIPTQFEVVSDGKSSSKKTP